MLVEPSTLIVVPDATLLGAGNAELLGMFAGVFPVGLEAGLDVVVGLLGEESAIWGCSLLKNHQ
jgi:hypothetical protein